MNCRRSPGGSSIRGIILVFLLMMSAPLAGIAQSGSDSNGDWIVPGQAIASGNLDLTFEVSSLPLFYGHIYDAVITVANGTEADQVVKVNAMLGEVAHFVGGGHGVQFKNPDEAENQRYLTWPERNLPAGALGRVSYQFLVTWDANGDIYLSAEAGAVGSEDPLSVSHIRQSPQYPEGGGGFLDQYGGILFFFLLFVALQVGLYRYSRNSGDTNMLKTVSIIAGLLLAFFSVSKVWNAVETYAWQATSCEVLDVRYTLDTSTSSGGPGSRTTIRRYSPLLTLRYEGPQKSIVSTGFRYASSSSGDMSLLKTFRRGTSTDCFYNPSDPGWVVVVRGLDFWSIFFALLGLLVASALLWFGLRKRNSTNST